MEVGLDLPVRGWGAATDAGALLSLLRFVSPSLPIGAYAYSRALEYAVHCGAVHDEASAADWILGLAVHTTARLDGPVLLRLQRAFEADDDEGVAHWNGFLLASRESSELRLEDTQLGAAFARLLLTQGVGRAEKFCKRSDVCYASMFALAAVSSQLPEATALLGFMWTQAEGQVSAAVRLIPLGQTAGQNLLSKLIAALPACVATATALGDAEIGAFTPGLALASALHETQYTRLFRS
jgi:urease accessory protein